VSESKEARGEGSEAGKRKRKKHGGKELTNFYRFQLREAKRQQVKELREGFKDDVAKVKALQESKQFKSLLRSVDSA
jgi:ribosomal RNA-processing protein 7